jgi:hypothetical protein
MEQSCCEHRNSVSLLGDIPPFTAPFYATGCRTSTGLPASFGHPDDSDSESEVEDDEDEDSNGIQVNVRAVMSSLLTFHFSGGLLYERLS